MSSATPATWAGMQAEVVLGDDVGAAGGRVGLDRLAVAEHQDHEHGDMASVIGTSSANASTPSAGDEQDAEDLLAGVGVGGERVAGEHRERGGLAEALV